MPILTISAQRQYLGNIDSHPMLISNLSDEIFGSNAIDDSAGYDANHSQGL